MEDNYDAMPLALSGQRGNYEITEDFVVWFDIVLFECNIKVCFMAATSTSRAIRNKISFLRKMFLRTVYGQSRVEHKILPANDATIKQDIDPVIKDRRPTLTITFLCPGAMADIPPIVIPSEAIFENPHSA